MNILTHVTTPINPVRFNDPLNNQQLALCNDVHRDLDSSLWMGWKFYQSNQSPYTSVFEIIFGSRWNDPTVYTANVLTAQDNVVTGKTEWVQKTHKTDFKSSALVTMGVVCPAGIVVPPIAGALSVTAQTLIIEKIVTIFACTFVPVGVIVASTIGTIYHLNRSHAERECDPQYLAWKNRYLENAFLERDDILSNFLCPLTGELPDIPVYIYGCGHNEYMTVDFLRAVEILHRNVGQLFPHTKLTCSASRADRTDPDKKYISADNLYLDYAFLHTFARRVALLRENLIKRLETGRNNADSLTTLIDSVSQKLFAKAEIYNESKRRRHALAAPSPLQTVGRVCVFPTKCITARDRENACSKFFRELFTPEKPYVRLSVIPNAGVLKCLTGEDLNEPHAEARFFSEFPNVDPSPLFHFPGDKT